MNHYDAEISDILVILDKAYENDLAGAIAKLKTIGMEILEANDDNSVVEGSVETYKVHEIEKLDCVDYVRKIMSYVADYPPGDPRDKDGPET